MTQAIARRIALGGALAREALGLEEAFATGDRGAATPSSPRALHAELDRSSAASDAIPFLDDPDLRFRHRVWRPGADRHAR